MSKILAAEARLKRFDVFLQTETEKLPPQPKPPYAGRPTCCARHLLIFRWMIRLAQNSMRTLPELPLRWLPTNQLSHRSVKTS
jgi:hypothetical protein